MTDKEELAEYFSGLNLQQEEPIVMSFGTITDLPFFVKVQLVRLLHGADRESNEAFERLTELKTKL